MGGCVAKIHSDGSTGTGKRKTQQQQGGSFELSEHDKNFRTLVYKKRRLSDSTLEQILMDPVVSVAFRQFLYGEFGETKLGFWYDCDKYRKMPLDTSLQERQDAAAAIYNKYLGDEVMTGYDIDLDQPTKDQIANDLMLKRGSNGKYVVTATDTGSLDRVFYFASLKAFQEIKFTYLPVFMTSKHFEELRGTNGFFKDLSDANTKAGDILNSMDTKFILSHPLGLHYLLMYINMEKLMDGHGDDCANLYMEISHFQNEINLETRQQRLERILKRYSHLRDFLVSFKQVEEKTPLTATKPPSNLLNPISDEIIQKFQEIEAQFKENYLFLKMTQNITTSSVNDYNKVTSFKRQGNSTAKTIRNLDHFAKERNIMVIKVDEELTLEKVLGNSQGLCFFKRFVIQNFMEDSILFWIDVEKFRNQEIKAQEIIDRYLKPESPMLVNISNELRETTIELVKQENNKEAFDAAQQEVLMLLKTNLWKKFQQSPRFEYLKQRFREREFIKETQGHVGQMSVAGRRTSLITT